MKAIFHIIRVAIAACCLMTLGGVAFAQWPIFGPGNGMNYRPGESSYEAGARLARESQERARLEKTKYIRSATWPQNVTNYTREIRYYLTQTIMTDKSTLSMTTVPGIAEEGMSVRFYGDTPIGYARIDKNGDYSDEYWLKIGKVYSNEAGCYIWVCGDETTGDMFFKVSNDKELVNLISPSSFLQITNIYNTTTNHRINESGVGSDSNYVGPIIDVENSSNFSGKRKRTTCTACNGTGKGMDQIIYRTDYTGKQQNEYCSQCGKWGSPHSHHTPTCSTCHGKGYIDN